jgi:ABC-type multidrug transport system fused ATPase/permease subunit
VISNLLLQPFSFWIAIIAFFIVGLYGVGNIRKGVGIPLLAVLFTALVWYPGDVLYNDYRFVHMRQFTPATIDHAWWQVTLFLLSVLIFVVLFNRRKITHYPQSYFLYHKGVNYPGLQQMLSVFLKLCFAIWFVLLLIAFVNVGMKVIYFALPILGQKVSAFGRPRIGGGFSAVLSLASNLYLLVGAGFGVVAALSTNRRIRMLAIIGCVLVWPNFFLDRTRNTMLAVFLPGVLAYVFMRLRASNTRRFLYLLIAFLFLNFWFSFVMQSRTAGISVNNAFLEQGIEAVFESESQHAGLNMFEELCWMNLFIEQGSYKPKWGQRYFAELVNPIPRALWPGKPVIGLDYSAARGQRMTSTSEAITGTISTGMIGQGVNNFGIFLGPVAAALLMGLWVTILARMDNSQSTVRLPLFLVGLVLTFNLGRDITFLVLYPFFFGWLAIKFIENRRSRIRPVYAGALQNVKND